MIKSFLIGVLVIIVVIAFLAILPIALIWSLNTLFPSSIIESTFTNYLAVWVLLLTINLSK